MKANCRGLAFTDDFKLQQAYSIVDKLLLFSAVQYKTLIIEIKLVNLLTESCKLLNRQGRLLVATVSLNELGDVFKQDPCDPHNEIYPYVVKTILFSLLGFM